MIKMGEVQDALEKRKSKKPINKSNGFFGCKACNAELFERDRFCKYCGQRLDWGLNK